MTYLKIVFAVIMLVMFNTKTIAQISENIEQIGRIYNHWGAGTRDHVIVGDLAYVSTEISGLRILNISNPENPIELGYFDQANRIARFDVVDGYAYLPELYVGLRIVNIRDPENTYQVALIETEGLFWEVKVQGDYAYLVGSDLGLKIFNVSDPENP